MSEAPTNPNACLEDEAPCDAHRQSCPGVRPESQALKSINIDIGWAFSGGAPAGEYELVLNGQQFAGRLNAGAIRIDRQLSSVAGSGHLSIAVTNGPMFYADVELGMPPIHTPEGLTQRLTNLGFYAGVRGEYNGRAKWAIRAFKRKVMNEFVRAKGDGAPGKPLEPENDEVTPEFMKALQDAYAKHPNDSLTQSVVFRGAACEAPPCGMFGSLSYKRSSFEVAGAKDDRDPEGNGSAGVWAGGAAAAQEYIAGAFPVYLRAFDLTAGDSEIHNRVNLPQPIHMAQFVLFELGYWLVAGEGGEWVHVEDILTRRGFTPDGGFGRSTQWAVREFQCYAKMSRAAVEDVNSTEGRYMPRLRLEGVTLAGNARYPSDDPVSGVLNQRTRNALQAWTDQTLRCPVVLYATKDNPHKTSSGDLSKLKQENIWLHNDFGGLETDRVYALDYSRYYSQHFSIPQSYLGEVSHDGRKFPKPIVVGQFEGTYDKGPVSYPWDRNSWESADAEVRPDTMIGKGGLDGDKLGEQELSTFKVVRTAAHFECLGYFDALNAYDNVTISFGPCHWTMAWCKSGSPTEAREMPAFLAYVQKQYAEDYKKCFRVFGLTPEKEWPIGMNTTARRYEGRLCIDTESGPQLLCGALAAQPTQAARLAARADNRYCKTWHSYYRFQMACRASKKLRLAMWDFTRMRIRDVLDKTLSIAGVDRRIGDYVTSEKGVAMLLRWHIFNPDELFEHLAAVFSAVIPNYLTAANAATALQPRENDILLKLKDRAAKKGTNALHPGQMNDMNVHMPKIHGWTNIPQKGLTGNEVAGVLAQADGLLGPRYELKLTNPVLSGDWNSFKFLAP